MYDFFCPFCGCGEYELIELKNLAAPMYFVSCLNCDAQGPPKDSEDEALDKWQIRATKKTYLAGEA